MGCIISILVSESFLYFFFFFKSSSTDHKLLSSQKKHDASVDAGEAKDGSNTEICSYGNCVKHYTPDTDR